MATFNPFAKQKTIAPEMVTEEQNVGDFEEVDLMPEDSVTYFTEKLKERDIEKLNATRLVEAKKREILSYFGDLEGEKQKRSKKAAEIRKEVETLREEQQKVARKIVSGEENTEELEGQLKTLSVAILSAEAKMNAYGEDIAFNTPKEERIRLKEIFEEFTKAERNLSKIRADFKLLGEIKEVIKSLGYLVDSLENEVHFFGFSHSNEPLDFIAPYIEKFTSQSVLSGDLGERKVRYFEQWVTSDSDKSFDEYSKLLSEGKIGWKV